MKSQIPEHKLRQAALDWAKAYGEAMHSGQGLDPEELLYVADEAFLFTNAHEGRLPVSTTEFDEWLSEPVPAGWDRIEGGTDQ